MILTVTASSAENSTDFNANGTVYLDKDITINKTFEIKKTLTIEGNNHSIDANHTTRIFKNSGNLTIKNLILKNANAEYGSAIYNTGNLIVINCQFINNVANSKAGPAIYSSNGYLTVKDSRFIGNIAYSTNGGAVTIKNPATITNCLFEKNQVLAGGTGARGGAIYATQDTKITNCIFKDNTCDSTYQMNYKHSKTYQSTGGAIYFYSGKHTVKECKFQSNHVDNDGGAILGYKFCEIEIINSLFDSNKALYEDGGAISFCGKKLTITKSKFTNNYANEDGGAIDTYSIDKSTVTVNIQNCEFIKNTALKGAGAIWLGIITKSEIKNTKFTANKASVGGALYIEGKSSKITNCKFIKNQVSGYTKYSKNGDVIKPSGGAIDIKTNAEIKKCEFSTNSAKVAGGAIYNRGKLTINSCKFEKNKAQYGGAMHTTSSINMDKSSFSKNIASKNGGAITAKNCKISVKNSKFSNNKAINGGAIFAMAKLSLSKNVISKNTAQNGAGLFNEKGSSTLNGNVFSSNRAKKVGGAIAVKSGKLTAKSNTFLFNKAKTYSAVYSKPKASLENNWWGNTKNNKNKAPSSKLTNVKVHKWLYLKLSVTPKKISKGKTAHIYISLKFNNKNKKINGIYDFPVKLSGKKVKLFKNKLTLNKGLSKVKFIISSKNYYIKINVHSFVAIIKK